MKHLVLTTIAAVVLMGCGEPQQSATTPEAKPIARVAGAKAPDISIHAAASTGYIEGVKKHLAAGTDVNTQNEDGLTPLHRAVSAGKFAEKKAITKLLIANGANVNAMSDDGETPLDVAIRNKLTEIADLLRKHGGKTKKELEAAGN